MTTSAFIAEIGIDTTGSGAANGQSPTITLLADTMLSCSYTFSSTTVNTFSKLIINMQIKNRIPIGGKLIVNLPTAGGGAWTNNIDGTKFLQSSISTCAGTSGSINPTLTCNPFGSSSIEITNLASVPI